MTLCPRNLDQHLRTQIGHYGFNQILHYEDHSAMQALWKCRSPFVDYRLMEFAFSLPDRLKFDYGVTKRIQREAFASRLPESIVGNHYKIGFATPFQDWMKHPETRTFIADIIGSRAFQDRQHLQGKRLKTVLNNLKNIQTFCSGDLSILSFGHYLVVLRIFRTREWLCNPTDSYIFLFHTLF